MKIPALHKYYTVNILFYVNFFYILTQPAMLYSEKEYFISERLPLMPFHDLLNILISHINIPKCIDMFLTHCFCSTSESINTMIFFLYDVFIFSCIIEFVLRKLKKIKKSNTVNFSVKQSLILYSVQLFALFMIIYHRIYIASLPMN